MTDSQSTTDDNGTERRYGVFAETLADPYHNYTMLGGSVAIDHNNYDNDHEARVAASQQALERAPETTNELADDELLVIELSTEPGTFVSIDKALDTPDEPNPDQQTL